MKHRSPQPEKVYQASEWGALFHSRNENEVLGGGAAGPGKALPLGIVIPTPLGMRRFGELAVGDEVFAENGSPARVTGVSPVMHGHKVLEVVFDDGSSVLSDEEHLWLTMDYNERASLLRDERRNRKDSKFARDQRSLRNRPETRTTAQIAASLRHLGKTNHAVQCAEPLILPEATVPLDPYLLGIWLGDGSRATGQITSADEEIPEAFAQAGFEIRKNKGKYLYGICGLSAKLRQAKVFHEKHIPEPYQLGSIGQRMRLLQGLVDTDGHIDRDGRVELTLCDERLAADAYRLIGGLGFKATMRASDAKLYGKRVGTRYRICWSPMGRPVCRLPRKLANIRRQPRRTQRWRYIVDVREAPTEPVRCITVDSESRLFLVGTQCIPTHNSLVLLMDPWIQIHTEHQRCAVPNHPYPLRWGESQGHALHLRRTSPMLDDTIRRSKQMFPKIYPDAVWKESELRWTFPSGFQFSFGHVKDPDSWADYQSKAFTHIAFDEAWQFTEEQYLQIASRLRCTDSVLAGDDDLGLPGMMRVRLASNPNMSKGGQVFTMKGNPYWLRERFVDPEPMGNVVLYHWIEMSDGRKVKRSRLYMPANLWHNPDKNFVRKYEEELQDKPHHIRQALLYGNWYITANSFFAGVWNERLHTCDRFRIPRDWPRFRAMDWGFKLPGCVLWFAMDEGGNLFVERELKFQGKTDREIAHRIREIEEDMDLWDGRRSKITGPADTQLWEKRGDSSKSKAEVFAEEGVTWTPADKTSREANAQRVYKRLSDHGGETTTPGLVIFRDCKYLIKTLPALQSEEGNPECPQDGGDDHATDALFYGCAFASRGRRGIPRLKEWDEWDDEDKKLERPRGQYGYGGH